MKPPIHFARGFVQRALSTEETEVEALKRMGEADMLRQELDAVHRPLWGYLRRLRQNRQSGKVGARACSGLPGHSVYSQCLTRIVLKPASGHLQCQYPRWAPRCNSHVYAAGYTVGSNLCGGAQGVISMPAPSLFSKFMISREGRLCTP